MIDEKNLLAVIKNQQEHIQERYNGKNVFVDIKEAFSLFAEIVESQSKIDKWIPCSERLPKENGYYLITVKIEPVIKAAILIMRFRNGRWYPYDKDDEVLAWQPLPKPYKEEKK